MKIITDGPNGKEARIAVYDRRMRRIDRVLARLGGISDRYWKVRRAIFLVGLPTGYLSFQLAGDLAGWVVVVLLVTFFSVVAFYHRRVRDSIESYDAWRKIEASQVARINLDWQQIPPPSSTTVQPQHPFEVDLDITGDRSIHRLMDTCITKEGSQRLRDWLLTTEPDFEIIGKRQALVKELSRLVLFRDRLRLYAALASKGGAAQWEVHGLFGWLEHRAAPRTMLPILMLLGALSAVNLTAILLWVLEIVPAYWPVTFLIYFAGLYLGFGLRRDEVGSAFSSALSMEQALTVLLPVFRHLERYRHGNSPNVAELCAPFRDAKNRPSRHFKRVARIAAAISVRANPLLWLWIHIFIPWDFYWVHRLNKSRTAIASLLPAWLDTWFELEALNSLANFAHLNPDYSFPEVAPGRGRQLLRARGLGHPLIPHEQKVTNDFAFDKEMRLAIITGSNMAGKSSFLRSLGLNLCLGYAGGPVDASELHTSLFRVFTCIKISDSVTDGFSYFYAEVKRLKALLTAIDDSSRAPVFYLIDEIFRGTNNRERLIGSRSYLRALVHREGMGAVATHDLELARLEEEITQISNFHFREEVIDGRMVFDYRLRRGPCPTTNALKIMQIEGLPVEAEVKSDKSKV